MIRLLTIVVGIASALALAMPAAAQDREFGGEIELVDPNVLRVCADPNNLPFSNEAEAGFEQEVARFLADKLGRQSVSYTYFPQAPMRWSIRRTATSPVSRRSRTRS